MTAALVVGCMLLAYGPSVTLLLSYAARRSALLLLTIGSAFAWLFAVLLASAVWWAIPPLKTTHGFSVSISVVAQEAVRILVCYLYSRLDSIADGKARTQLLSRYQSRGNARRVFNDPASGIACGLGFALVHTVFWYGALLASAAGPAAWYRDTCPHMNAHAQAAGTTFFLSCLHVALGLVSLEGYRMWRRGASKLALLVPVFLHLLFELAGLLNEQQGACTGVLPLQALAAVLAVACAVWMVRRPSYQGWKQMKEWEALQERLQVQEAEGGSDQSNSVPFTALRSRASGEGPARH